MIGSMPLYLCRWENGDCSFVSAPNKSLDIELLDEIGNAESCPLLPMREFMVHFRLSDTGQLELEGFGEHSDRIIFERAYPVLDKAWPKALDAETGELTKDGTAMIRAAVEEERRRLWGKRKRPEPETEWGRRIKAATDMPAKLVDRIVKRAATRKLKRFRGRGKPN